MMYLYRLLCIFFICCGLHSAIGNAVPLDPVQINAARIYQAEKISHDLSKMVLSLGQNLAFYLQGINTVEAFAMALPSMVFPVKRTPNHISDIFYKYVFNEDDSTISKSKNFVFSQTNLPKRNQDLLKQKGQPHIYDNPDNYASDVSQAKDIIANFVNIGLKDAVSEKADAYTKIVNAVYFKARWGILCRYIEEFVWKNNKPVSEKVEGIITHSSESKTIKTEKVNGYNVYSLPLHQREGKYKFIIAMPENSLYIKPEQALTNGMIAMNCIDSVKNGTPLPEKASLVFPSFRIEQQHSLDPLFNQSTFSFKASQAILLKANYTGLVEEPGRFLIKDQPHSVITIDEPFAYWVVNEETGKILFTGVVYDPET
ncbi:MAG: hypothetical protein OXD32_01935 [Endozoicomonadaceae bacterium]|nr:hypothetical protein [Endozoicomonadaceae bacterium]